MAGRPTEYTEDLITKALHYKDYWQLADKDDVIPTIEGLGLYIGVSTKTIYEWCKDPEKEELSNIVIEIRQKKSKLLQNKALKGDFKERIAGLLLGHEGYRQAQDVTTDGEKIQGVVILPSKEIDA